MTREKLEHMNPRALYHKCRSLGIAMRRGETPPKAEMVEAILNFEKAESLSAPDDTPEIVFSGDVLEAVFSSNLNAKEAVEVIEKIDESHLGDILAFELNREPNPRKTVLAALEARGIEVPTTEEEDDNTPDRGTADSNQDSDNPSGEEVG